MRARLLDRIIARKKLRVQLACILLCKTMHLELLTYFFNVDRYIVINIMVNYQFENSFLLNHALI